ncbi:4'-phosphopantetheinyl transferase family protein [Thermodesulfobacteriota bacterium]
MEHLVQSLGKRVFYGAAHRGATKDHCAERKQAKEQLLSAILEKCFHVGIAKGQPHGQALQNGTRIDIVSGRLGRPLLYVNGQKGPDVSFTHLNGSTWAALCPENACVGIDAACMSEFEDDYPYGRAFHKREMEAFRYCTQGKTGEAAAMIWSAKEAVVKALGCGFHLLDPLDLEIVPYGNGRVQRLGIIPGPRAIAKFPTVAWDSIRLGMPAADRVKLSIALVEQ